MKDNLQGTFNGAAKMPLTGYLESELFRLAETKPGSVNKLQDLMASGVNLEHKDDKGQTAFMVACRRNNTDMIIALADAGAKLDIIDNNGVTPLFYAIAIDNEDAVRKMMEKGLHPDHARYNGMTQLMHAANFKKIDIVDILIEYGADHTLKSDDKKMTAADYALNNNKPHIADRITQMVDLREKREELRRLARQAHIDQIAKESEQAFMDALQNQGMPTAHPVSVGRPIKLKTPKVLH
ncbi:MAG: ankyrin repeat domain-containing protein [Alphaproteobacteria bacterium]